MAPNPPSWPELRLGCVRSRHHPLVLASGPREPQADGGSELTVCPSLWAPSSPSRAGRVVASGDPVQWVVLPRG